jgi:diaminopropionate ammonia-lyase
MNNDFPIKWKKNPEINLNKILHKKLISIEESRKAVEFHKKLPGYRISPLKGLDKLAAFLGLGGIWVKDESQRLTLNSFKILGSSYAIYKYIKKKIGADNELSFNELVSAEVKEKLGDLKFAAATDGNHGRGVAWAASKLGLKSIIYVHENTSLSRIEVIKNYGAELKIIKGTYDEAVEQLEKDASANGWQVISDTAWEGYEEIPEWVMQGYSTMYNEIQEQLAGIGLIKPTHIFVQAGVGSLAASVINYYANLFKQDAPISVVVEPDAANCIFKSAIQNTDKPYKVILDSHTIMAGLECGNPNPIAWNILHKQADYFFSCPDYVAAKGMRVYGMPLLGDPLIISGESGAVTLGALMFIMCLDEFKELKNEMKLDSESQILLINTEGNTDPINFRQVVWDGYDPVPDKYRNFKERS